jgi:hypothetical protein
MAQQRFIFNDQQFHNALLGKSTSPKHGFASQVSRAILTGQDRS